MNYFKDFVYDSSFKPLIFIYEVFNFDEGLQ